jgi:hypothetical protein
MKKNRIHLLLFYSIYNFNNKKNFNEVLNRRKTAINREKEEVFQQGKK